ncbi:uncharacterized protein PV09_03914 [Verruconis gallopava]|uniref:Uncharacterized protein n=1 Tax=Verruconis gallopava TaxID=253628 RepID=A0A0D1XRT7_9PEZI|nr:uncharacterized protein PV09_03914 [Verruconis gallopava]KIW05401.1 hypothetical protein PV09_03914 [Verruconis gallopava]
MTLKNTPPSEEAQRQAYVALSQVFVKYQPPERGQGEPHPPLTIEILPKGIDPPQGLFILEDEEERSVGIPKKVLVAAFLHARRKFMATTGSERESEEMRISTMVILLFDPEFLTAANARKQYLLNMLSMKEAYGLMHKTMLKFAVRSELWFLDSILTSPLHRQSKSPTLWYQRAWVYHTFAEHCDFMLSTRESILVELGIVLKAGEQHRHNYYAFQYARRVLRPALDRVPEDVRTPIGSSDAISLHRDVFDGLLAWCKSHPSDTSGWSFLLYWLSLRSAEQEELCRCAVRAVLQFAVAVRWKGEALWSFLRTMSNVDQASNDAGDRDGMWVEIHGAMADLCPTLIRPSAQSPKAPGG